MEMSKSHDIKGIGQNFRDTQGILSYSLLSSPVNGNNFITLKLFLAS